MLKFEAAVTNQAYILHTMALTTNQSHEHSTKLIHSVIACPEHGLRCEIFRRRNYAVVHPPLGLITWPIMNLESSEAR